MKTLFTFLFACIVSALAFGQTDTLQIQDSTIYRVVKTDNSEHIGYILSDDAREILLRTIEDRDIFIPQHLIKEIRALSNTEFTKGGKFIGEDKFATRYFITTNGLPIKKGEHYVQWNLYGPDFQFAVGENLGVGIMTSWLGIPIIGNFKKSWRLGESTHLAVGGLIGTGSWAAYDVGGALPFASLSFGNRKANFALSGGYGAVWERGDVQGRALTSIAGMVKVSPKFSLVFDSFILLPKAGETTTDAYGNIYTTEREGFALLIPGIRWHRDENRAFQFGFSGFVTDGNVFSIPIPMLQWYRSL